MRLDRLITVVGAHAEGEGGRVITGGVLPPRGETMFERMETLQRESDWLRGMLLSDPRGGVLACVNLITPPARADADFGMIVIESDYYVPMSGSNLICTVTVALETGIVPMREPETVLRVDTAAGLVLVTAECRDGRCRRVRFANVPSFVMHRDATVEVEGLGTLRADVAYGGMIYVIVDAAPLGFGVVPSEGAISSPWASGSSAPPQCSCPRCIPRIPAFTRSTKRSSQVRCRSSTGSSSHATRWSFRPDGSTAARVEPAPARAWRCCTHAGNSPSANASVTGPSSTRSSSAAL